MKNGPLFLLGLLVTIAISFVGVVIGSHAQLGNLVPFYDDAEGQAFPQRPSGIAARGQLVYGDLGCASCHTQQVRRPDFGSDQARGWGDRQSVARDYIHQSRPQLGASRLGPDLKNFGARNPVVASELDILNLLFSGSARHPAYPFLFETRKVAGEFSAGSFLPAGKTLQSGFELVATERGRSLAAYLLSLTSGYDYPESKPVVLSKKVEGVK